METGYSQSTFRFRKFPILFCRLFLILFLSFFIIAAVNKNTKVYAASWFTVLNSGVLSRWDIIDNNIPTSGLPAGFNSSVVQPLGSSRYGSLLAGRDIYINTNNDVYVTKFNASFVYDNPFLKLSELSTYPLTTLTNLDPNKIYRASDTTSLENLMSSGTYSLNSNGLAIIFVSGGGSLDINKQLVSSGTDSEKRRLLILTDQKIFIGNAAGTLGANFDSPPAIQASLISYQNDENDASGSFAVSSSLGDPFILEGPIASKGALVLGRETGGTFPGVYIKQNPLYVIELSKKGYNNTAGVALPIKGLLNSKITWRYE